jgi:hypothetical protein
LVFSGLRILAAISFSQASCRVDCRDRFIGWDNKKRKEFLPRRAQQQPLLDIAMGERQKPGLARAVANRETAALRLA